MLGILGGLGIHIKGDVHIFEQGVAIIQNQGMGQNLIHMFDRNDFQLIGDGFGDILEVLLIFLGDQDLFDTAPVSGNNFFLQTANRQYPAPQRNFTGMAPSGIWI